MLSMSKNKTRIEITNDAWELVRSGESGEGYDALNKVMEEISIREEYNKWVLATLVELPEVRIQMGDDRRRVPNSIVMAFAEKVGESDKFLYAEGIKVRRQ